MVKFDGCYHGHSDALLASAGSGVATLSLPGSAGVTDGRGGRHGRAAVQRRRCGRPSAFDAAGDRIACVIVEPVAANMGVVPPAPGFLERLCGPCDRAGALLVFDEVITGFRLGAGRGAGRGSASRPTSRCSGRSWAAGCPLAAFGGRADVMERLAPVGPVYQAGTLSGNPVAVAAGLATLRPDRTGADRTTRWSATAAAARPTGSRRLRRERGVPHAINRVGLAVLGVLRRRARSATTRRRERRRSRRVRAVVPRDARARGVPAAVRLRGVVPGCRARDDEVDRIVDAALRGRGGRSTGCRTGRPDASGWIAIISVTKISTIITVNRMNAVAPSVTGVIASIVMTSFRRPHAGPYQAGAVPPVRIALRLRSARSRNGRWMTKPTIETIRNTHDQTGTFPLSWYAYTRDRRPARGEERGPRGQVRPVLRGGEPDVLHDVLRRVDHGVGLALRLELLLRLRGQVGLERGRDGRDRRRGWLFGAGTHQGVVRDTWPSRGTPTSVGCDAAENTCQCASVPRGPRFFGVRGPCE